MFQKIQTSKSTLENFIIHYTQIIVHGLQAIQTIKINAFVVIRIPNSLIDSQT